MIINKNKDSYLVLLVVEEEGIVVVVLQPFLLPNQFLQDYRND